MGHLRASAWFRFSAVVSDAHAKRHFLQHLHIGRGDDPHMGLEKQFFARAARSIDPDMIERAVNGHLREYPVKTSIFECFAVMYWEAPFLVAEAIYVTSKLFSPLHLSGRGRKPRSILFMVFAIGILLCLHTADNVYAWAYHCYAAAGQFSIISEQSSFNDLHLLLLPAIYDL